MRPLMSKLSTSFVYLSPHLDDAVYSCGGLIRQQVRDKASVEVWTVCAGDPPVDVHSPLADELIARWGTGAEAVAVRRAEDEAACEWLGAEPVHLNVPDCIFRRSIDGQPLYPDNDSLFGRLHMADQSLIDDLAAQFRARVPSGVTVLCPLTVGNHVDHQLTRAAAERAGLSPWYYLDFPYALEHDPDAEWLPANYHAEVVELSDADLAAWQRAIAAHASQLSTFWSDITQMEVAVANYAADLGGVRVYRPKD